MDNDAFGLPPLKGGLRAAADRLRQRTTRQRPEMKPPEENGVRLSTIPRGDDEELRLSWAEYNGKHFLNIRIWSRREDTWWPEKGKGLTVRVHELADFADGVSKAVEMALGDTRGDR